MTGPIVILALARDHGPVRIHTAVVFIVIPVHGMKVRALVNHQYLHTAVLGPALPCAVIRNRAELPIAYVHQLFRLDDALFLYEYAYLRGAHGRQHAVRPGIIWPVRVPLGRMRHDVDLRHPILGRAYDITKYIQCSLALVCQDGTVTVKKSLVLKNNEGIILTSGYGHTVNPNLIHPFSQGQIELVNVDRGFSLRNIQRPLHLALGITNR